MHFTLVLLAVLIVFCSVFIKRRLFSPLSKYPGPLFASYSRLWYTYVSWRGTQHDVFPRLHEKHGDVVRVAPNEV